MPVLISGQLQWFSNFLLFCPDIGICYTDFTIRQVLLATAKGMLGYLVYWFLMMMTCTVSPFFMFIAHHLPIVLGTLLPHGGMYRVPSFSGLSLTYFLFTDQLGNYFIVLYNGNVLIRFLSFSLRVYDILLSHGVLSRVFTFQFIARPLLVYQ